MDHEVQDWTAVFLARLVDVINRPKDGVALTSLGTVLRQKISTLESEITELKRKASHSG